MNTPLSPAVRARRRRFGFSAALHAILCAATHGQTPPECLYAVTDLGTLGGSSANAMGLNQLGQACGWAYTLTEAHAFLWTDGVMIDLGTLDVGTESEGYDVNDLGEVVGWSQRSPSDPDGWHAFLWSDGDMIDLGTLGGTESLAYAINNLSQVVGRSKFTGNVFDYRAFLWDSGVMYDLGSFDGPGTGTSLALDINNSTQVVGGASGGPFGGGGFLWENGTMQPLDADGGNNFGATALNDLTQVVGQDSLPDGWRTYLWEAGVITLVGEGFPTALNGLGHVLGDPGLTIPVLWRDGLEFDLNDCLVPGSGWTLIRTNDINDAGQIVGYGIHQGFSGHRAFILDPCPAEPDPGTIVWNASPTIALRGTRSVTFSVAAARTATCFAAFDTAIEVRMIDLQTPMPPNAGCCPSPDFSAYESETCTAGGETNGCARWVGPSVLIYESQDNSLLGSFLASRLQCTPYYTDWSALGMLSVFGAEIVPSSTYELTLYPSTCAGNEGNCTSVSAPVQLFTRRSGDVASVYNPPMLTTQPDGLDVVALVNKFKNLPGAPSKAAGQISGNAIELNLDVSGLDIGAAVDAFKGLAYPYSGPCACPSSVTCNATPCASAASCSGGLCVRTCVGGINLNQPCLSNAHCPGSSCGSSFCRDRCGRCN